MIDTRFRKHYQKICIEPVLNISYITRCSPVLITCFGLLAGIISSVYIVMQYPYCGIFWLLLSGYFDTLDGSIARKEHKMSQVGAVLDITCDRVIEFAIICSLFLVEPVERALPSILMLGSVLLCVTTFLVVGIFSENTSEKSFYYSTGIMERAEAFLFWILMLIFPHYFSILAYLFTALVLLTAGIRLIQFNKQAQSVV